MSAAENAGRTPWLLAAPALLLFVGIVLVPIAMTVLLSFHDFGQYKGIDPIITLKNWREIVGAPGDFRKTGFVRIVHPHESSRLKANVDMQQKLGVKVELIDKQQLQKLEPDWKVDDVDHAAYEPDS